MSITQVCGHGRKTMECSGRPVEVTDPKTDPEKDKRDANVTICHYSFSSLSSAEASDESKITNVPLNLLEMVSSAEFQNRYKAKPSSLLRNIEIQIDMTISTSALRDRDNYIDEAKESLLAVV
ncbi:MAG: hypothetical protein LQ344_008061 [Seirophora lacunosa]|nr:MAG: hypothetical protein LQ344_008061 [Seirophora lacunosa]